MRVYVIHAYIAMVDLFRIDCMAESDGSAISPEVRAAQQQPKDCPGFVCRPLKQVPTSCNSFSQRHILFVLSMLQGESLRSVRKDLTVVYCMKTCCLAMGSAKLSPRMVKNGGS